MKKSRTQHDMENIFSNQMCTCTICGRSFIRAPEHMYKVVDKGKTLYFCRYNHYVQWLKEHDRW